MSGELRKAYFQELPADPQAPPMGPAEEVQFNPQTLKLTVSASTDAGKTAARQSQQYASTNRQLSFDLIFDTTDEGDSANPVDVRLKVQRIERFLVPMKGISKQVPARVLFHWGTFLFRGVMNSMNQDFELFSPEGVPLRAKVSVTISEQDKEREALERGDGANAGKNATNPGGQSAGPGTSGGPTDRTGIALAGETAADFAARMGLDPAAWRGLSGGLELGLSLQAGVEIDFSAGLSTSAGIGVNVGIEARADVSLEASFGLEATASASFGAQGSLSAGMALSAAGGVNAAVEAVRSARAEQASASARAAFGAPGSSAAGSSAAGGAAPARQAAAPTTATAAATSSASSTSGATARSGVEPPRAPLRSSPAPLLPARAEASPAPLPRVADPRAASYGFGVPLRPRVASAGERSNGGFVVVERRAAGGEDRDPTAPPWADSPGQAAPARAQGSPGNKRGCRCGGACGCRGGSS